MRAGVAALLVAATVFAGCLSEDDEPASVVTGGPGVFYFDGDQVVPAGAAPWLQQETLADGRNKTVIDRLALMDPDLLNLVLIQAIGKQDIDFDDEMGIEYAPPLVGNEGEEAADFGVLQLVELDPPGDAYLAAALGQDAPDPAPTERRANWFWYNGESSILVRDYGLSFDNGLGGYLEDGQYVIYAGGSSGIPATDLHADGNAWQLSLTAANLRIIILPSPLFLAGVGFGRFEGTRIPIPSTQVGGHLEARDRYGATVAFLSSDALVTDSRLSWSQSAGRLNFGDEQVALHDFSRVWRTGLHDLDVSLDIDQWQGTPMWMLTGYSVPHPDEVGLDNGGNATIGQAPAWR